MDFDEWLIRRLRLHGAYGGRLDGVHGREVIEGLKRFQGAEGLKITGAADPDTVTALRKEAGVRANGNVHYGAAPVMPAEPVWMREAQRFMGLKEIAGPKSSSTIMGWAKRLGGWVANVYTNDDIPWCGLFQASVIAVTLPREALPSNPLSALAWATFGHSIAEPSLGAILVFRRDGGGHVGQYVGEDDTHFHVLGGNQSNTVSITRVAKSRLVSIRWPNTGEPPRGGRVYLTAAGAPVSENEA